MVTSQEINNWKFQYQGQWYSAKVPGNNFSDLLNNGFIPDPFYGTNEHHDYHHAKRDGNYSSTFTFWDYIYKTKL